MKKTIIIGASPNDARYSYKATKMLSEFRHPVIPLGIRSGNIEGHEILSLSEKKHYEDIDTVTLYLSPENQGSYIDYILSLHPKRVIFNPGTYNPAFIEQLEEAGIEAQEACTLVLLRTHQY
ncbi:CoA-binding protein [Persicobacter psychrovividus]|uniref:CoA-binding protein n=1 Tax=Persicobacter psychrovividus TaxID=387638 RepID=A0ABM7VCB5_9BACT|nr:CoA-binding protein [Persicobacter psychrovividus]